MGGELGRGRDRGPSVRNVRPEGCSRFNGSDPQQQKPCSRTGPDGRVQLHALNSVPPRGALVPGGGEVAGVPAMGIGISARRRRGRRGVVRPDHCEKLGLGVTHIVQLPSFREVRWIPARFPRAPKQQGRRTTRWTFAGFFGTTRNLIRQGAESAGFTPDPRLCLRGKTRHDHETPARSARSIRCPTEYVFARGARDSILPASGSDRATRPDGYEGARPDKPLRGAGPIRQGDHAHQQTDHRFNPGRRSRASFLAPLQRNRS